MQDRWGQKLCLLVLIPEGFGVLQLRILAAALVVVVEVWIHILIEVIERHLPL